MKDYGYILHAFHDCVPPNAESPQLTDPVVRIENRELHQVELYFALISSARYCEYVYLFNWWAKPMGVLLVTNRCDLFLEKSYYLEEMSELQSKKLKLERKLAKVKRKMDKIYKEVE
jgi:hypothetical protein